jgi:hypothetical protein
MNCLISFTLALLLSFTGASQAMATTLVPGTPGRFNFNGMTLTGALQCDIDYDVSLTGAIRGTTDIAAFYIAGKRLDLNKSAQVRVSKASLQNLTVEDDAQVFEGNVITTTYNGRNPGGSVDNRKIRVPLQSLDYSDPRRILDQIISSFAFNPDEFNSVKLMGGVTSRKKGLVKLTTLDGRGNRKAFAACPLWNGQINYPPQFIRG